MTIDSTAAEFAIRRKSLCIRKPLAPGARRAKMRPRPDTSARPGAAGQGMMPFSANETILLPATTK